MTKDTRRTATIIHEGSEADWRVPLGIIARQLLRGSLQGGSDVGRWEYKTEIEGEKHDVRP